jgi:D-alanyl-D-alanine dipeptidase
MKYNQLIFQLFLFCFIIKSSLNRIPKQFVYIRDIDPTIKVDLKYYGEDNFIGRRVPHYKANKAIMTKEAAKALSKAQKIFLSKGYSIVVYDSYRPASSVKYFVEWMRDVNDTIRKKYHYPYVETKTDMEDKYIASRSGHSRGSTVDMSIIKVDKKLLTESVYEERVFNGKVYPFNNDNTIDCGTSYDLMDPASWADNNYMNFTDQQISNRNFIRKVMENSGFQILPEEWWHFTLKNEPYPDTYFDFDIQ